MADHYVYVDPTSGNDGTGAGNDNSATAASTPYQTLVAALAGAITAGENNRVTKAGNIHFRLLNGLDSYSAASTAATVSILSASWTTSTSYKVLVYGHGTGIHNGLVNDTGNGYTLRRVQTNSGNQGNVIETNDVHAEFYDFRILNGGGTGAGSCFNKTSTFSSATLRRMLIRHSANGGFGVVGRGSTSAGRNFEVWDSVLVAGYRAFETQSAGCYVRNCTLVSTGTSGNGFYANNATQTVEYCYAHSVSGAAFDGSTTNWSAGTTRNYNASSDTTAYDVTADPDGINSVAYSTSSGAYFTNVTAGSLDFSIGASSTLKDAAVGSTSTLDVKGATRATPDIGAFEYISLTAPTVTDAGDETFQDGETGIVITGTNFGASQGAGTVKISPTNNVADGAAVSQTVTGWADTSITITAAKGALGFGATVYLFVTNNGANSNAAGYAASFITRGSQRAMLLGLG